MKRYRQLSFLPVLAPAGRPDPDAEALRCRAGVEFHEINVREILNRSGNRRLPFVWTINPYRGCEFACSYCYARYTHGFFDLHRWEDFEEKIFVKRGAARSLRRKLRRAALANEPIAFGTATDPYQPAEHHYRVTRSLLEEMLEVRGLQFSITTKSPIILRDLELLRELKKRHRLRVNVTITCLDTKLARRIEGHAPTPPARMRTVKKLADAGIYTTVFCMPIMPSINSGEDILGPLFQAARRAGARNILPNALYLRKEIREPFLQWLEEEFPELAPLYGRLYSGRSYLPRAEQEKLLGDFRKLKAEFDSGGRPGSPQKES
mgnify:CR=1 FL=1